MRIQLSQVVMPRIKKNNRDLDYRNINKLLGKNIKRKEPINKFLVNKPKIHIMNYSKDNKTFKESSKIFLTILSIL